MDNSKKVAALSLIRVLACLFAAASVLNIASASPRSSIQALPLVIEKNQGQAPSHARFLTRRGPTSIYFTSDGIEFVNAGTDGHSSRVSWQLVNGAHRVEPNGHDPLPSHSNYFMGSDSGTWVTDVENDSAVVYPHVYPGIDLVFHASGSELENDFRVAPGSDPAQIAFGLDGGRKPALGSNGDLAFDLDADRIVLHKPVAYQETPHGRVEITAEFAVEKSGMVRFHVGAYDRKQPLIIDPVFGFSTYFGGSISNWITAVTTDAEGNIYVTGYTTSRDFPLKDPIVSRFPANSQYAMFVASLDPLGKTLRFSTYLGGAFSGGGFAIAIDGKGNIVVAGAAGAGFPHAGNLPKLSCGINDSCYVLASISKSGAKLNYAGEAGGSTGTEMEAIGSLAVDAEGNAYLAGITDDKNFPVTPGTLSSGFPGYPNDSTFIMKFDPTGTLLYSTPIPGLDTLDTIVSGANVFYPSGMAVDAEGRVTMAGTATTGLPTTPGVLGYTFPNDGNAENAEAGFLLKINAKASAIVYATYLPGTDVLNGLAIDKAGNAWVAGTTWEDNLPVSPNAYQKSLLENAEGNCSSGFVMEVVDEGRKIGAATYLQGPPIQSDCGTSFNSIAIDSHANVYVGGATASPAFPMVNPFATIFQSPETVDDMVLAGLSPDLSKLRFGSFLNAPDLGTGFNGSNFGGMTIDAHDDLIVVGSTDSIDFPTTPGTFEPHVHAGEFSEPLSGFIAKLVMATPAPSVCISDPEIDLAPVPAGTSRTASATLVNCGNAPLHVKSIVSSSSSFAISDSCALVGAGATCPISITYTAPTDGQPETASLKISDDAQVQPQTIQLSGGGAAPLLISTPYSVSFGDALVGTMVSGIPVTISGVESQAAVDITSATIQGDFAIVQNHCLGWLETGNGVTCTILLAFKPSAAGTRTGQLTVSAGGGAQLFVPLSGVGNTSYLVPLVGGIEPQALRLGGPAQTITISGWNFYPGSVVEAGGKKLPTRYVNDQQLSATLAPGVLTTTGSANLSVFNPAPGGGSSNPVTIAVYRVVPVDAVAIASVPGSSRVYAAIPANARTNANSVIAIEATTGEMELPIHVGNNPQLLAASSDGKYLYVAENGAQQVQRINLATNRVERTFPFPSVCTDCTVTTAVDLQVVPGRSLEFVLALQQQVALYNSSGLVDYAPKAPGATTPANLQSIAFAGTPPVLYGLGWVANEDNVIYTFDLGPSGISFVPPVGGRTWPDDYAGSQMVSDGMLLYTSTGLVFNPVAKKQVGTFPPVGGWATYYGTTNLLSLVSDPVTRAVYEIGDRVDLKNQSYPGIYGVRWRSLESTGFVEFSEQLDSDMNDPVRWGGNGLAFLAQTGDPQYEQVFVLTGLPVSKPGQNPKPVLSAIYPDSVALNALQGPILLTGSGIGPETVVNWNGKPLSAVFFAPPAEWLSSSAMVFEIPPNSLSSPGTFHLTLTNPGPGGGTSQPVTITVTANQPYDAGSGFSAAARRKSAHAQKNDRSAGLR